MKKLLLFLGFSLGLATTANSIPIKEFNELAPSFQDYYLSGLADGVMASNVASEQKTFCLPNTVVLGVNLAEAALDTYLRASNDDAKMEVSIALILGMKEMFPCK